MQVTIKTRSGSPTHVSAIETETPGLVVHRFVGWDDKRFNDKDTFKWTLTHIHTGMAITNFHDINNALECGKALGEVADWDRHLDSESFSREQVEEIRYILFTFTDALMGEQGSYVLE